MEAMHKNLAEGHWQKLSLCEQMSNIGSEILRALSFYKKGDHKYFESAFERAMELIYLTLKDPRWKNRRKEIARLKEVLCDYLFNNNTFQSSDESFEKYFLPFMIAARR